MNDPLRWSEDDAELDADERRLLHAGLRANVPRGAKRAVWLALGAQLPPVVAAASTAGSSLTLVSLLKTAGVGLFLGAATMGTVAVVRHESASPAASSRVGAPASAATDSPRVAQQLVPAPASEPPLVAVPSDDDVARPTPGSSLPETAAASPPAPSEASFPTEGGDRAHDTENQRVRVARGMLRKGRAGEALVALEALRRDLPDGELAQEREALSIEALRSLGRNAEARPRAAAFLERYPKSPYAATARRALE